MLILTVRFVRPPPLTPFGIPLRGDDLGGDRPNISGALMTQYLMALLGYQDPATLGMPENGRMGDYVFNQEGILQRQGESCISSLILDFQLLMRLYLR